MGSDIYLSWKGMSEADKKKRYTGFSIGSGNVGYLRASIGMIKENMTLHHVFPKEFWKCKPLPYDFRANWKTLNMAAYAYLLSVMFNIDIPLNEEVKKQVAMGKTITKTLQALGADRLETDASSTDLQGAVMWINSLFDFFLLGIEKQEKNLNPTVEISW